MSTEVAFDVPSFINSRTTGITQYGIVLLCGLVMFLDGFDTQAISYMAPSIAKEWGLTKQLLGPIFSSALTGLMVGYLLVSPFSDRFGHRKLVIISTFAFALLTFVTGHATNVTELIALRFLTGIALGSVVPSAIALTTEFSPARLRATFVLAIYAGFSLGFVAAGAVAAWAIPEYGWRSMLWIGGAAPMVVAILALMFLPESMDFLIRTKAQPEAVWRVVRLVDGALPVQGPTQFITEAAERRSAVGSLFSSGRTAGTLVIWIVFMLNLAEFYALQSWLPSMLTNAGHFSQHGHACHEHDHRRRYHRRIRGRAGDGPHWSLRLPGDGLSVWRPVCYLVRLYDRQTELDNGGDRFLCRLLHQWRTKERDRIGGDFLSDRDQIHRCGLGSRNRQTWRHWRPAADWGFARLSPQRAANSLCCWDPDAAGRIAHSPARPLVWAGY
ncbi:MFS family permease [Bradyrhizobium sp. LM3.6]